LDREEQDNGLKFLVMLNETSSQEEIKTSDLGSRETWPDEKTTMVMEVKKVYEGSDYKGKSYSFADPTYEILQAAQQKLENLSS
jgi:hypothetical protein